MKAFSFVLVGMAVMVPTVCLAGGRTDPLRCEALQLNRESRHQMCLARCERKAERSESFDPTRCEESCDGSLKAALQRILSKRVCSDPPPDPHRCEAKLLKVEANRLVCESRCVRKGERNEDFEVLVCVAGCAEASVTAHDDTMGSSVCADGRMLGDG